MEVFNTQIIAMDHLNKTYKEFAEEGIKGITQFVDSNNSLESLKHQIIEIHIDKTRVINSLIENNTNNDIFDLLSGHPEQIKFCRQLFIHRENLEMNLAFLHGIRTFKPIIFSMLKNQFNLSKDVEYFNSTWMTIVESWYSKLDVNNLTVQHMKDISKEIAETVINLNK